MATLCRGDLPTGRALEVLGIVSHEWAEDQRPVTAARVAERLGISRPRVAVIFRSLNALGWLRAPGSPAIPTRDLPHRDDPLTEP
jgi:DNA-binding FadR family transcriptional regulator